MWKHLKTKSEDKMVLFLTFSTVFAELIWLYFDFGYFSVKILLLSNFTTIFPGKFAVTSVIRIYGYKDLY